MKISVILAHPNVESFNHAIAFAAVKQIIENGHTVLFHDLHSEKFDPLMTREELGKNAPLPKIISDHCTEISEADGIIIIHPNWWGQPSAILKGWVDRVLRAGIAYEFIEGDKGEGVPNGLLKAKTAIVYNTSNTEFVREKQIFGDPLELIWKNCIFDLCGVPNFHRRMFCVVVTSTPTERGDWLAQVQRDINSYFPKGN